MPNRVNYQKELDRILAALPQDGEPPALFLHACCAPCSSDSTACGRSS